jgi:cytochrome c
MTVAMKAAAASMLGAIALLSCNVRAVSANAGGPGKDGSPVVKITAPGNNSLHGWNSLVNYSIVVSYQGKSTQYQEIPANEVLLAAAYVPDLSVTAGRSAAVPPAGLLDIVGSNCLGCHDFKAKAMGPSFAAIAARYPATPATVSTLAEHIRDGSRGVWGQASMSSHSQLTEDQLRAIVLWILKSAADPDVSYYVGTEGAIRMEAPGTPGSKAGMILTASYTAPPANPEQAARGEDTAIVRGK